MKKLLVVLACLGLYGCQHTYNIYPIHSIDYDHVMEYSSGKSLAFIEVIYIYQKGYSESYDSAGLQLLRKSDGKHLSIGGSCIGGRKGMINKDAVTILIAVELLPGSYAVENISMHDFYVKDPGIYFDIPELPQIIYLGAIVVTPTTTEERHSIMPSKVPASLDIIDNSDISIDVFRKRHPFVHDDIVVRLMKKGYIDEHKIN